MQENIPECSVQRRHYLTQMQYTQEIVQENDRSFWLVIGMMIVITLFFI